MDISKLIYSECHNPIKVKVYNGIRNCYEEKLVPCGNCYHCKITRINEWVTRMVAESNYNKYVYYGTLTYNGKKPTVYNDDCLSMMSNFNKTKRYNDTPIILRKDHLQKFFKRLRKNTGIKFQYAACGEYGSTYSRPHYHYIIWSNEPISQISVYKAWTTNAKDTVKKVIIGKVEHRDIKNNPDPRYNDPDGTWAFKYVCKYIHKFDFDFKKLTNYNQHVQTYEKEFNCLVSTNGTKTFLSPRLDNYLIEKNVFSIEDYEKVFSPFFVCSKKPAIGYKYLQEHIAEFQKCNFKLFGLPKEYIFPIYFIRKTKESICPLKAQSETNAGATSYCRLPKMAALIDNIQTAIQIADDTNQIVQLFRDNGANYTLESNERIIDCRQINDPADRQRTVIYHNTFSREYLGFVNIETGVRYSFRYNACNPYFAMYDSHDNCLGNESLENVKLQILYYYEQLKQKLLLPLLAKSEVSADKKTALINAEYNGDVSAFQKDKEKCLEQLMNNIKKKQKLYKQTKTFE